MTFIIPAAMLQIRKQATSHYHVLYDKNKFCANELQTHA